MDYIRILILSLIFQSVLLGQNSPFKILEVKTRFIRSIQKELPYTGMVWPPPRIIDDGCEYRVTIKVLNPHDVVPKDSQLIILCFLPDKSLEKIYIVTDSVTESSKGCFFYSFPIHVYNDGWVEFGITQRVELPVPEEIDFYRYLRRDEKIYLYERHR